MHDAAINAATNPGEEHLPTLTRRTIVLGAVAAPLAGPGERGATWPSGTIKIVVPFPPGGSADAMARLVQPGLQQRLGATIIIENRPGASGSVGTAMVAKSPPDGNTWLIVFDNHAVNPFCCRTCRSTPRRTSSRCC